MTPPTVSIVMPAYNRHDLLRSAVDSVIAQSFAAWELVIVDDGSTDGTFDLAKSLAEIDGRIRAVAQENAGPSAARNRGIREAHASSEYISFLDSDDLWTPQTLELLIDAIEAAPDAVGAHGVGAYVDADGQPILAGEGEALSRARREVDGGKLVPRPVDHPTTFAMLVYSDVLMLGSVVVRRATLSKVGGFDEQLPGAEDHDLWTRLAVYGDFVFVDKVVMYYRQHGTNTSSQKGMMLRSSVLGRQKLLTLPELSTKQRELADAGARLWRLDYGCSGDMWPTDEPSPRQRMSMVGTFFRIGRPVEAVKHLRRLILEAARR